jgi:hypothetical protein
MNEIARYRRRRFWLRLLFVVVAYFVPLAILAFRFDFFQMQEAGVKISGTFIILSVLILFQFKKELYTWIESWEFSLTKIVLLGFAKVWAFLLAIALIGVARFGIDNIEFIVGWIGFPQIVAYLTIKPFAEQADHFVKRELRKAEVREALREDRNGVI